MKKILFLSVFFLISAFIGYENPRLIEDPKKYIKFYLKKLNLINNFVVSNEDIGIIEKEKYDLQDSDNLIIEGNYYNLVLNKKINFEDRTAGFFINDYEKEKIKFNIFLQNGVNIQNKLTKEIFLPSDVSFDQNGGVKSVFKVKEKIFALVSNKKINCAYASIYEIEKQKNIFTTKCLPDIKNVDFNGLGGAVVEKDNFIFISIGAPEWDSREISSLAQNKDFLYGKIIKIEKNIFQILK